MTTPIPFIGRIGPDMTRLWVDALSEALPGKRILPFHELSASQKREAKVAIVANPDPAELVELPNLEWIHSLWAGVERMMAELPWKSVRIVRLEDPQLAETMAEAVLAWVLYLHRNMPLYARQQRERLWQQHNLPLPSEVTVAILGMGHLGRAAARRLRENGFPVVGWARSARTESGDDTAHGEDGLRDVLAQAKIVVVLLPLSPETKGLLSRQRMLLMSPGVSLINFARGPIMDTDAMMEYLDEGRIEHAVLDVFNVEPLPAESPLWAHPSVTILPHISAPTNLKSASRIVSENILNYLETGKIRRTVDWEKGY